VSITSDSAFSDVHSLPSSGLAVDIGTPAYCRPRFIGETIESVLAQTYKNWRLVVSENGPGGGEVEAVVRQYTSDPRVRYVATGRNLGPAANWTRLLQAGTAPYFAVIQDDDKWDPDFLARRVGFFEAHPSCGFVFAGERKIDQHGRTIDAERTPSLPAYDVADVLPEGIYSPREFIHSLYRYKLGGIQTPTICSLGVMSRRSALEAVGPAFDETHVLGWDWELYMRMALRFPTGFMAIKDASHRIHHPSITSEASFEGENFIHHHEYYGEWFRRELPGLQLPREYDEVFADAYIMAALDALERGDRRRCARHVRSAVRRCPSSITNPRIAASAAGLMLGRTGTSLLARTRATRRRRSSELVYDDRGPARPSPRPEPPV
jgi:glycosyltransferase involved in cell wall biosynthesis